MAKLVQSPPVVGLVISVVVFLGLLGLQLTGSFEALELAVYDTCLRLRPDAPADARIVLITVTENDIRQQGTWPLPDATIARALVVLGRNNPSLYTVNGRPLYVHLNGLAIVLLK